MVRDNPFNPTRDISLEKCEGNTIKLIPDGTKIGFGLHVPTEEYLSTTPHIYVTYCSEWNPNTVKIGKVYIYHDINTFYLQQHIFVYHTMDTGEDSYLDNGMEEAILNPINPALVKIDAKLKSSISEIVTSASDDIPA